MKLGLNRAVLARGLAFASRCGLPQNQALEILKAVPSYSRAMDVMGRKMLQGDLVTTERRNAAEHPRWELHVQLLEQALALGFGQPTTAR